MNGQPRVSERNRRACLLAGIADVNPQTAAKYLNGEPVARKQRDALEKAERLAQERLPEIVGGAT